MEKTTTLSVTIPTDQCHQLRLITEQLGVSAEDLVRMSIQILIAHPQQEFTEAVKKTQKF